MYAFYSCIQTEMEHQADVGGKNGNRIFCFYKSINKNNKQQGQEQQDEQDMIKIGKAHGSNGTQW